MKERKFVFVVCGAKEHINTLHFSLRALENFSKNEIWIVTDSTRNEIPVIYKNIIDVRTPEQFNHHQASIYLKTSLYKILPKGNLYCYLDTDVIALNDQVDDIFNHKTDIINFAADHSRMHQFSPYAVNCGCLDRNKKDWRELNGILKLYDSTAEVTDPVALKKQQDLKKKFEIIKLNKLRLLGVAAQYVFPFKTLHLDDHIFYDKAQRIWFDAEHHAILYDIPKKDIEQIEKNSNWKWNILKRRWISPEGRDVHQLECNHLKEAIEQKFEVKINHEKWQHWNGGVFLFDDESKNFMHLWHTRTMKIFKDPRWKTRDQGTLIATAWQLGLQNTPLLSKKFNFIADPSNPKLMIDESGEFISDDAFETKYAPSFIHIFHRFGETGWDVWDWIIEKLGTNYAPEKSR